MKKITKILSVLMAAVMLMTALCVPAYAADELKSAKLVDSGSKVSFKCKFDKNQYGYYYVEVPKIFKVEVAKKGTLQLDFISGTSALKVDVMTGDGSELLVFNEKKEVSGRVVHWNTGTQIWWNENLKKAKSTLKYEVEKGTYYVKVYAPMNSKIDSKTSITFTYPQDKSESSDSAKITSFTATLKKGSTLQLGTILSGEGTVTWSTSKKSVATVTSKGKITAKAKGTAVITAKTGDSSMKITIKVTE